MVRGCQNDEERKGFLSCFKYIEIVEMKEKDKVFRGGFRDFRNLYYL